MKNRRMQAQRYRVDALPVARSGRGGGDEEGLDSWGGPGFSFFGIAGFGIAGGWHGAGIGDVGWLGRA